MEKPNLHFFLAPPENSEREKVTGKRIPGGKGAHSRKR